MTNRVKTIQSVIDNHNRQQQLTRWKKNNHVVNNVVNTVNTSLSTTETILSGNKSVHVADSHVPTSALTLRNDTIPKFSKLSQLFNEPTPIKSSRRTIKQCTTDYDIIHRPNKKRKKKRYNLCNSPQLIDRRSDTAITNNTITIPNNSKLTSSSKHTGSKNRQHTRTNNQQPTDFVVESIVDKLKYNGKIYYEIKWAGYTSDQNTYESRQHLLKEPCAYMIHEYDKQLKLHKQIQLSPDKQLSQHNMNDSLTHLVKNNRFWNVCTTDSTISDHINVVIRDGIIGKLNVNIDTQSIHNDTVHDYIQQLVDRKHRQGYVEQYLSSPNRRKSITLPNIERDPDLPTDNDTAVPVAITVDESIANVNL